MTKVVTSKESGIKSFQCWIMFHSVGLIWVETICKGYQQTTKVVASKESGIKSFQCWIMFHSVGPDLGPNYLQRLSADDKSGC